MKFAMLLSMLIGVGSTTKWFTSKVNTISECGKNEQRVRCSYECEPRCGFEPTVCNFECKPNACVCKDGFVRNTKNECVRRLDCTPETSSCPEDEEFQTCGTLCEPSCDNPYPTGCRHDRCVRNVCRCLRGFVRNGPVCTPLSECDNSPSRPLELFTL